MMMVEEFANSTPCTLGDFSCAFRGADDDILAGHARALADIAGSIDWVKRDKIARTFPSALGRGPSALGGSFANVFGTSANVATGAGWMGLPLSGRLRCASRLRRSLGLAILTRGVLTPDRKCESKEHEEWCSE
jgi:hypothetical protein